MPKDCVCQSEKMCLDRDARSGEGFGRREESDGIQFSPIFSEKLNSRIQTAAEI